MRFLASPGQPADGFHHHNLRVVRLLRARRAAAVGNLFFEQTRQLRDHFEMLGLHVHGFTDVFAQVVELNIREALLLRRGVAGFSPASAAGAQNEFPISLTDGKSPTDWS